MKWLPILVLTLLPVLIAGCGGGEQGGTGAPSKVEESAYKTTPSGLKYAIIKEGTGAEAKDGDQVKVHYTGWLKDGGAKFDSSVDRGEPFDFSLGRGEVIPGWDEGVKGMKSGEKRQLVIPADLGYGDRGSPPNIPGGATLVFDVEYLGSAGDSAGHEGHNH